MDDIFVSQTHGIFFFKSVDDLLYIVHVSSIISNHPESIASVFQINVNVIHIEINIQSEIVLQLAHVCGNEGL